MGVRCGGGSGFVYDKFYCDVRVDPLLLFDYLPLPSPFLCVSINQFFIFDFFIYGRPISAQD